MKIIAKIFAHITQMCYLYSIKITQKHHIMTTDFTYISKKAKDGKVFRLTISRRSGDLNEGWSSNGDFFWTKKSDCIKATKQVLSNMVEDYEYDNNLR